MVYKVTKQDFLSRVKIQKCEGKVVKGGKAEQNHSSCNGCQGNYFHDGECNWGGRHTMEKDLMIINQNFANFNSLLERQEEIYKAVSETDFNKIKQSLINQFEYLKRKCESDKLEYFAGTCIQIDGHQDDFLELIKGYLRTLAKTLERYIRKIQKLDYWQLKAYKEKRERLEEMQKEAQQIMADYKDAMARGDTAEAQRLMGLYQQKKQAMGELMKELKNNPVDEVLGEDSKKFFSNIVKNIFGGKTDFFNGSETTNNQDKEKKFLWFIPRKYAGKAKLGIVILFFSLVVFLIYRWIKSNN